MKDVFLIKLYDAVMEMVAKSHARAQGLAAESAAQRVYLLYYHRMLTLIQGAMEIIYREDVAPSVILMRSALECYVDLYNLSRDGEDYLLVMHALLLENRSALFHYKTQPHYDHFVRELGEAGAAKMGKQIAAQLKETLKKATEKYPILRYQARNLTVLNRFRIADMEERYQTNYTWLSMEVHNALEPLLIDEGMRMSGRAMEDAQGSIEQATVMYMAVEFLVDMVKCTEDLFGADEGFTRSFLRILERVKGEK